jgi:hypothetical protein
MELFRNARILAGNHMLAKKTLKLKRERRFLNLSEAKHLGIAWNITDPDDLPAISDFMLRMSERGIKVVVLGFFNGRELPDKLTAIRYLTCLKREDLSFWYIPISPEAGRFIEEKFDILIEICFMDSLPLRFVSTISRATLKVGPCFNGDKIRKHNDILIDVGQKPDVREYLKQAVIYLEMINKPRA